MSTNKLIDFKTLDFLVYPLSSGFGGALIGFNNGYFGLAIGFLFGTTVGIFAARSINNMSIISELYDDTSLAHRAEESFQYHSFRKLKNLYTYTKADDFLENILWHYLNSKLITLFIENDLPLDNAKIKKISKMINSIISKYELRKVEIIQSQYLEEIEEIDLSTIEESSTEAENENDSKSKLIILEKSITEIVEQQFIEIEKDLQEFEKIKAVLISEQERKKEAFKIFTDKFSGLIKTLSRLIDDF